MPATIRRYHEKIDAQAVGILIAETYRKFNLGFTCPEEQQKLLGPFYYTWSADQSHRDAITRVLRAEMIFVAEDGGQVVGVVRCRPGHLQSLFVSENHQRQGIGTRLVAACERWCDGQGSGVILLAATLYAVPFYHSLGYKKSTGIRAGWSFEGRGLLYQPMKKELRRD